MCPGWQRNATAESGDRLSASSVRVESRDTWERQKRLPGYLQEFLGLQMDIYHSERQNHYDAQLHSVHMSETFNHGPLNRIIDQMSPVLYSAADPCMTSRDILQTPAQTRNTSHYICCSSSGNINLIYVEP
ncbi:hypothetical protein F2P81_010074 [Scophthalmus maximus]|uniref:Uncharacterized protein n=1 Tax=Scophthalmus maximus TaxID=52904 RepID=A0A6A4SZG7_SCOMX|nr:hypothetical protein F2P81_010074 [Scophthalmus maximus]